MSERREKPVQGPGTRNLRTLCVTYAWIHTALSCHVDVGCILYHRVPTACLRGCAAFLPWSEPAGQNGGRCVVTLMIMPTQFMHLILLTPSPFWWRAEQCHVHTNGTENGELLDWSKIDGNPGGILFELLVINTRGTLVESHPCSS